MMRYLTIHSSHFAACAVLCTATLAASALLSRPGFGQSLSINANETTGTYSITAEGLPRPVLEAGAAVDVEGHWLKAADYPRHTVDHHMASGALGSAEAWTITYSGRPNAPDLLVEVVAYKQQPFGEVSVTVRNATSTSLSIQGIRTVDADNDALQLGGPRSAERVLSDSFSEDRPGMKIHDFADAQHGMHRAVGSQIVYNLASHQSWFIGALTSEKFLSVLRLRVASPANKVSNYQVESTGTTELLEENSLEHSGAQDRVMLALPLEPGASLQSERMLFSVASDPVSQLETYGRIVREQHHARVSAPVPMGWWSWTAYYFGLNDGAAKTNALWLAQNLKSYGYTFVHIDEGYQFARGEYATPDADLFPRGLDTLEREVTGLGLTPGIWTAPFEVSERSWVFQHHPEWLVKNARGTPIHLGTVADDKDQLYALDTTNPDAQGYLRETYTTLTRLWNIRYIKLDFMEDSAVEGFYFKPHTTALEAQRIGLEVIRKAVGEDVLLDKDGCEMLNPVGIVDMGRISQDTGHTFDASKDAATGIAARFFMNRNYFVADPDAFSASTQTVEDHDWHGGKRPLSADEAKVSVVLSAVSGGLFEIGDDLPTLGRSPDRLAWLRDRDLLDMVRLGRAAKPIDLLTYAKEDLQPSIFVLKETPRQAILAVFNWTDGTRTHDLDLSLLGLDASHSYTATDLLAATPATQTVQKLVHLEQPLHSVRLLKLVDTSMPQEKPAPTIKADTHAKTGANIAFQGENSSSAEPAISYHWDFGDGTALDGNEAVHAYTEPGTYKVTLTAVGVGGATGTSQAEVTTTGEMSTVFHPETQRRLTPHPE